MYVSTSTYIIIIKCTCNIYIHVYCLLVHYTLFIQVGYVLAAIQAGAVGTQACNEAIANIKGIVGDLETSAMFVTAGALMTDGPKGTFTEHCHNIVETAKVYVFVCLNVVIHVVYSIFSPYNNSNYLSSTVSIVQYLLSHYCGVELTSTPNHF